MAARHSSILSSDLSERRRLAPLPPLILSALPCGLPDRGLLSQVYVPRQLLQRDHREPPGHHGEHGQGARHDRQGRASPVRTDSPAPKIFGCRQRLEPGFPTDRELLCGVRYPAERVKSAVGILYPRSSAYWDLRNVAVPTALMDCTNSDMDSGTMDYFAEVPTSGALFSCHRSCGPLTGLLWLATLNRVMLVSFNKGSAFECLLSDACLCKKSSR